MTAKQVAKLMALYLGHKDLLNTTTLDGVQTPTAEQNERLATYLNCINDVVQMIAISYFPLKAKEFLSSENKTFAYSSFQKPLLQIVSVKDAFLNAKVRFETYSDFFTTNSNYVEVVYNYQPEYAQTLASSLEVSKNFVSPRLIALGAVSRYYLFEGIHSESLAWNNMFERAVLVSKTPKRTLCINKRSWF